MGGHGGLNILPQKRWNVYNFENREKVRKDEEEAARKEQEEQHKARARDAEFRLEKLKEAANSRKSQEPKATAPPTEASEIPVLAASPVYHDVETRHHINLFADLEAKEREEEAKLSDQKNFGKKQEVNVHKRSEKVGDEREKSIRKRKDEDIPKHDENAAYALGFGSYEKKGKRPWYMSESSLMKDDNHSEAQTSPSGTSVQCFQRFPKHFTEVKSASM